MLLRSSDEVLITHAAVFGNMAVGLVISVAHRHLSGCFGFIPQNLVMWLGHKIGTMESYECTYSGGDTEAEVVAVADPAAG